KALRVRDATHLGNKFYHGHSIGGFGPQGSQRRWGAHHPIRAGWQWIDRPPSAMAGRTVPQSSLSRCRSDSAGVAIVGVCFALVERGWSPTVPKRPCRGSGRVEVERGQRLLPARGLVSPTLQ